MVRKTFPGGPDSVSRFLVSPADPLEETAESAPQTAASSAAELLKQGAGQLWQRRDLGSRPAPHPVLGFPLLLWARRSSLETAGGAPLTPTGSRPVG